MPIIEMAALPPGEDRDVSAALGAVTTEVAAFLGEDPRGTWAMPPDKRVTMRKGPMRP